MSTAKSRSPGFTLVELLVVIAIIGILMSVLLPAANMAREAARLSTCQSNQNQIALAVLTFETTNGALPVGMPTCSTPASGNVSIDASGSAPCLGPSWLAQILEQLEETKKYSLLITCMDDVADNVPADCADDVGSTVPEIFKCPSARTIDPDDNAAGWGLANLGKGNYAGNFGAGGFYETEATMAGAFSIVQLTERGPFSTAGDPEALGAWKLGLGRGTQMASFRDGASKTVLLSEVLAVRDSDDGRGAWFFDGMGGASFTAANTPNEPQSDEIPLCDSSLEDDDPLKCTEDRTAEAQAAARSSHSQVVVAAFADRSVRPIANSIDPDVWKALCTRAGPQDEPEERFD